MEPSLYQTDDAILNHELIDKDALSIIHRLREAGHAAYLVGGCIRDLLIGRKPKDFDISTSALPEEIKGIFRRQCILIGRRFRLAHVRFGHNKIFEVSTFRSGTNDDELIVRDNEWGTPEEDALRRDFSVNGLFYDPENRSLIDYVGGWDDIQTRTLKVIGIPEVRFKQDPVRMLRLLKFQARFGFAIDPSCQEALAKCHDEIIKSAPARILEELFKMLESGAAAPFIRLLDEHRFLGFLLPSLEYALQGPISKTIYRYLEVVDEIHARNPTITLDRPILLAALIFPIIEQEIHKQITEPGKIPHIQDISSVIWSLIQAIVTSSFSHFPKRISGATAHLLIMQYRLTPLFTKRSQKQRLIQDHDFPLALRFLKIRALVDPTLQETFFEWQHLYRLHAPHGERKPHPHSDRYRRRRRRRPAPTS